MVEIQKSAGSPETMFKAFKIILIVFFTVGVFGIAHVPTRNLFICLTPVALFLCIGAIIVFHKPGNLKKEIAVFVFICVAGFLVEAAGVNTGLIFGDYSYGNGLWIKLINTPLIIGLNWVLLVYCTAVIADRFNIHVLFKILFSSLLMVLYDMIMEQIAPVMNMWKFETGSVPVRNYIAWFLLAIIFHSILKLAGINYRNPLAPFVFYVQAFFFLTLIVIFNIAQ